MSSPITRRGRYSEAYAYLMGGKQRRSIGGRQPGNNVAATCLDHTIGANAGIIIEMKAGEGK